MIVHPLVMFSPAPWSCELRYDPADPAAVTLATPKGEWHLARALLAAGLLGPAGCMDVRVRVIDPFAELTLIRTWVRHRQRVRNETTLMVAASALREFVEATYEAVPVEVEDQQVVDEMRQLIDQLAAEART